MTPAPLYEDPIWGGASDPVVLWNPLEKKWWMMYTQRRAYGYNIGYSCIHGTDIGIASSPNARDWTYRGTAQGLIIGHGRNTFWAPEVVYEPERQIWHMYVSYIEGVPTDWTGSACIAHFTSVDLWEWHFDRILDLGSDRVIDACIYKIHAGMYKMWFKDEKCDSHTVSAVSEDLVHWKRLGEEITDCPHEGPNVFTLGGWAWMITDVWNGLGVYRSEDFTHWTRQEGNLLKEPGKRNQDGEIGNHADVYVSGGAGYLFYFVNPGFPADERSEPKHLLGWKENHTVIQAALLRMENGRLICNRDLDFDITRITPSA